MNKLKKRTYNSAWKRACILPTLWRPTAKRKNDKIGKLKHVYACYFATLLLLANVTEPIQHQNPGIPNYMTSFGWFAEILEDISLQVVSIAGWRAPREGLVKRWSVIEIGVWLRRRPTIYSRIPASIAHPGLAKLGRMPHIKFPSRRFNMRQRAFIW